MLGRAQVRREKKEEKAFNSLFRPAIIQTRQSFQPGHKNSKNLFVLNISRERVVSYEVVHRYEGKRRFVTIGPQSRPMSGRMRVVIGRGARWSRLGDDRWQVIQSIGEPRDIPRQRGRIVTERRVTVVVLSPCITGRDRETVPVMIMTGGQSVTAGQKTESISPFPEDSFANTYDTEETVVYEDGWVW